MYQVGKYIEDIVEGIGNGNQFSPFSRSVRTIFAVRGKI